MLGQGELFYLFYIELFYRNKGVWEKSSKFSKQVKTNL